MGFCFLQTKVLKAEREKELEEGSRRVWEGDGRRNKSQEGRSESWRDAGCGVQRWHRSLAGRHTRVTHKARREGRVAGRREEEGRIKQKPDGATRARELEEEGGRSSRWRRK